MRTSLSVAVFAVAFISCAAQAAIVRVPAANFVAGSGQITFSEKPLDTTNPVYAPGDYGGGAQSPTVTFGGYFFGQSLSANAGADCPGAAATACVVGSPSGPLSLDPGSPVTLISLDGDNPTSPVLSGSPRFNGPIAVLFDTDQAGVGFDAGFFNAIGGTAITAFDRGGNLLGSVSNVGLGTEFLGLVTSNGSPQIAGVFLDLIGSEPAGFGIDNLRFGVQGQVVLPGVPEPASWTMLIAGFGLTGAVLRRRRLSLAFG